MRCFVVLLLSVLMPWKTATAETVVLRTADGRFLRAAANRTLRAESFVPGEKETFELVALGNQPSAVKIPGSAPRTEVALKTPGISPRTEVALKAPGNRWLAPDTRDGRTPFLTGAGPVTGRWTSFELLPAGENRYGFRSLATGRMLLLDPAASQTTKEAVKGDSPLIAPHKPGQFPPPAETIRLFCPHPLPAILQTAVPAVVNRLADEELAGKQYDKTWRHKTEEAIKVPDPTIKDPFRTKRQHLYAVVEESTVQARLDGKTDGRLPATLFLAHRDDSQQGVILLAVEAHLPVRGRVQYQMLNVMSASTNYLATVHLFAVAEIPVRQTDKEIALLPATVKHLEVFLSDLKLSNDILHAARGPIERTINGELRRNETKIRKKADEALAKAVSSREVKIPLLGFLKLL
jgi:hypothetical protein